MNNIEQTISMSALKTMIKCNLEALWSNENYLAETPGKRAAMIPPLMIWGAPGVGKSTVVKEIAEELKVGFIDVRLAQREPVDMRGLPVPENDRVKWLVSSEWPRDPESRGIIMFDELTAADRTLQVASYEFILDRRLGDLYKVPPGWYILAAGNRVEDRAVACAMSSALANRFLHVEVRPESESFLQWAEEHEIHPAVISFIRFRPELLFRQNGEELQRGWPSPRSWERVSTMLKIAGHCGQDAILAHALPGLLGAGTAAEFNTFLKNRFFMVDNCDIRERLLSGDDISVPARIDMKYTCCNAITYHIQLEPDPAKLRTMIGSALKFALKLSGDFSMMLITDIINSLKKTGDIKLLLTHPLYAQWRGKFQKKQS